MMMEQSRPAACLYYNIYCPALTCESLTLFPVAVTLWTNYWALAQSCNNIDFLSSFGRQNKCCNLALDVPISLLATETVAVQNKLNRMRIWVSLIRSSFFAVWMKTNQT
jgi:hypothetical protein